MASRRFALSLDIMSSWDEIDGVREATLRLFRAAGKPDSAEALSMVISELLENAVKYGARDANIALGVSCSDDAVSIAVTNEPSLESRGALPLAKQIEWLSTFEDPEQAFTAALARVFRDVEDKSSGLGLARIAYEGGCRLACHIDDAGKVMVMARAPRDAG